MKMKKGNGVLKLYCARSRAWIRVSARIVCDQLCFKE